MTAALILEQKQALYRDGYVVMRNAVAPELVDAARRRIRAAKKGENLGPEAAIIFRIRNKKRQPGKLVNGATDHPDRGEMGEWLEYEEGNGPWERSKDAMCNMWEEWEGMQETVAAASRT